MVSIDKGNKSYAAAFWMVRKGDKQDGMDFAILKIRGWHRPTCENRHNDWRQTPL